ncbi:hypothetical protein [Halalkalicoccus tibetensis]|uniref:Uncharacterized protein n=1 Tax=Halalkalicoccus tibetensis TaxID=175632 RepID=A0ABD5V825_9EURY
MPNILTLHQIEQRKEKLTDEEYREFVTLKKELNNHEWSEVLDHLRTLNRSNYIVDENYNALITEVRNYTSSEYLIGSNKLDDSAMDILRHLSNFVVSSKNREEHLLDHVIPRLEELRPEIELRKAHDKKTKQLNNLLTLGPFFKDLRTVFVHDFPSALSGNEQGEMRDGTITMEREIGVKTEKLLQSDKWSSSSKCIINENSRDGGLPLEQLIVDYYTSMESLYEWFEDYVMTEFEDIYFDGIHLAAILERKQNRYLFGEN